MANNKKVTKLYELLFKDGEKFMPSDKEQNLVSEIVLLFRETQNARNQNFEFFDGQNLIEYINDSVVRFNTNLDEREGIEDWQAAIHDPFTRNKVLAILGKMMEVLPIANFVGNGDEDRRKATILNDLYLYVEELDDYDELMTHVLLEAIVKGTAVGFEDVSFEERKLRDVKGIGDGITVTERTETKSKLFGSIVPLDEFYPSSVSIRKIKDMPYCFWRQTIPYSKFVGEYGHFKKSELVNGKQAYAQDVAEPYYVDYMDANLPDGKVEVIKFFDKLNDQYVILANGIWLNPLDIKSEDGTNEVVSPLPWNHKELPFWDVKFDFFGDFFYGKSLPDRLKAMQDVLNVLTNMLLDQSFLSIFPPLLTNGFDSIEDDYMRPGRRIAVDTQGLPIASSFQVLQTPTPSGWHQYILDYTRQVMEEASLDKVSQGVAGGGDRTTAEEIRTAASGVTAMLQLFNNMVNMGIKRKAYLKASNLMQFGFNTEMPMLRQVLGEDGAGEARTAFNIVQVENAVLSDGKRGTKLIEIYKDKASLPTKGNVKARAQLATADSGTSVEIVAIPPSYIRNFLFDVSIVPNPKRKATKDVEKALQMEKVQLYVSVFADRINMDELAAQTAEIMGDDPTKILVPSVFGIEPSPTAGEDMGGGTGGAVAANTVQSAANPGAAGMAQLMG